MNILALDTATEACSAALYLSGQLLERFRLAPRQHNQLILPMIDELLAEAGLSLGRLDALAFGRGPGSFTGVRIAAGVVQGIAFGADLPVAPISTLAALASEALEETGANYAFPCIDARMGEVYWGVYRRAGVDRVEPVGEECVVPPERVAAGAEWTGAGIGSGWGSYGAVLAERAGQRQLTAVLADRFPRAGHIARLAVAEVGAGRTVAAEAAQPVYLRDQVAWKPGERRSS
ncbi:MAG: tRNA (adenosine(37)-N6)-threonylcarbamoyltransferase complex dimerization subunit type 1 TsaB [Methylococcaceae bacterium]|nr:tRNA (adenosine(37)-N6)-threonylcarbamoyltransferase complex dimerization subunit type 1 TsaB [Methylococcaceae bacterium]